MINSGFIFDYSKCVGCHACIVGCYNENKTNPPIAWRQVNKYNPKKIPLAGFLNLSIACNHCLESPCLRACPANAYYKDEQTGAIIHQPEKCIGCKYCTWACPFDAPKYNHQKGVVEKCHFCNHLIIKGQKPACANQCPTGALSFGSIDSTDQTEIFGLPKTRFQPRIITLGADIFKKVPEMDNGVSGINQNPKYQCEDEANDRIHALKEWPLVLFTFIFSFLSGWLLAFNQDNPPLIKYVFVSIGLIGILLSLFHLGKPFRAPRAILNMRTSWLSREIFLSGLFISSSIIYLFVLNTTLVLLITIFSSIFLLLSIEMVYSITGKKYKMPLHSSNTFLIAFLFSFYFCGLYKLLVAVLVIKALLYLIRKRDSVNLKPINIAITACRLLIGLLIPISIVFFSNPINTKILLLFLLIGELIDRFEYYNDLFINSPTRVLEHILNSEIKMD